MRDVAARAQVSFKTVSRVVNEEGGVSPLLERRVRQAIEDLDFRPNAGARILRRSDHRTATIGLLLEDVANPFSAADPAGGGGRRRAARGVRALGQPRRGRRPASGRWSQAVRRPARRRAGARARRATTSRTWRASCGGARRSCASTGRRATCRSTRCSPPTTSAPRRGCGTSRPRATGASPTSATGGPSRPRSQRLAGYHDALAARGIAADPALVVQDIRDARGSRRGGHRAAVAGRTRRRRSSPPRT